MWYVGSKAGISRYIVPIIQDAIDRNGIETYVEPFVGGANVIDKIRCKKLVGYDSNRYLIAFWQALQAGWNPETVPMSKELYIQIKNHKDAFPPELVGLAGFCASYGARWFEGYSGTTKGSDLRNRYREAVSNVMKQLPLLSDVSFRCKSFEGLKLSGCMIYCDPPYEGATKYMSEFNHSRYWGWVRKISESNIVLCSEYKAPDDFECIWEKEHRVTLDHVNGKKTMERLFVLRGCLKWFGSL